MKQALIFTSLLIMTAVFFPLITLSVTTEKTESQETTISVTKKSETTKEALTESTTENNTVSVFSEENGKTKNMSVREYLFGTVCAEMPASFHEEALKAQAVASYTYLKWIKENSDNPEKYKADITDNSTVHQAFITEEELKEKWGTSYELYSQKINSVIDSVMNEYLSYENETAMTVFHAVSPGQTQSSDEIWTNKLPYLSGASAPGDTLSPNYRSQVTVTEEEFIKKLGISADIKDILAKADKNDKELIISISSDNKTIDRTELRSIFSLDSPYFTVKQSGSDIIFTVYGKGHGIGMSQYSADYMARQGSSYKEILSHFYKGTVLTKD